MRDDTRLVLVREGELARLNAVLRSGCSFGLRRCAANGDGRFRRHARYRSANRGRIPRSIGGVLVSVEGGTARASAVFPVALGGPRRRLLMSLARCVAECAMDLGLGTAIYSGRRSD